MSTSTETQVEEDWPPLDGDADEKRMKKAKVWIGVGVVLALGVLTALGFFLAWEFGYFKPYTGPKPPADDPRIGEWIARKRGQVDVTNPNCRGAKGYMDPKCPALPPKFTKDNFGAIVKQCLFKTDAGMAEISGLRDPQDAQALADKCQPQWDAAKGVFVPPKDATGCFAGRASRGAQWSRANCLQQCGWNESSSTSGGEKMDTTVGVSAQVLTKGKQGLPPTVDPTSAKACAAACLKDNKSGQSPQGDGQPAIMSDDFYACYKPCTDGIARTGVLGGVPASMFCEAACSMRDSNDNPSWFDVTEMSNALQNCIDAQPKDFPSLGGSDGPPGVTWTSDDYTAWDRVRTCTHTASDSPWTRICPAMVIATETVRQDPGAVSQSGVVLPYGQYTRPIGGKAYGGWSAK
jgi:hypothetical protein